jgi:hypothetical protein
LPSPWRTASATPRACPSSRPGAKSSPGRPMASRPSSRRSSPGSTASPRQRVHCRRPFHPGRYSALRLRRVRRRRGPDPGPEARELAGLVHPRDGEAVPVEVPAGSVVWFHRDLVHGSQSNRSNVGRRVFVIAYQPSGLHRWRVGRNRDIRCGSTG